MQYEVNPQEGLDCGGAYLKLFTASDSFTPESLNDKTPYTIMFGPDKCGANNKIHFIFRHLNPITGEWQEKHLRDAPISGLEDARTSLYTLVVRNNQTFDILLNNVSVKKGSLLTDMDPPVNPDQEVDDPSDLKPASWVDLTEISDESAVKPSEWDESAPSSIVDELAVKPDGWLENEPSQIPDPDVTQPEDWDTEEDGDWIAPSISNPKCVSAPGCGKWTPPRKSNPAYKGKWTRPMIANPDYKGEFHPRKITNPAYFEDLKPSHFAPMGAVGFELWSMKSGYVFDNIYIGHSAVDAAQFASETWQIKNEIEKKLAPPPLVNTEIPTGFVDIAKKHFADFLENMNAFTGELRNGNYNAVAEFPGISFMIVSLLVVPFMVLTFASSAKAARQSKDVGAADEDEEEEEVAEEDVEEVEEVVKVDKKKGKAKKE